MGHHVQQAGHHPQQAERAVLILPPPEEAGPGPPSQDIEPGGCRLGRVEKSKNGFGSNGYCFLNAFWYVENGDNFFF